MATVYKRVDRDVQISEATTTRRQVQVELGTAEAISTVQVRKTGGGATFGTSTGTGTQITGTLFELTMPAADLDTEGHVVYKLIGATDTTVVYGTRVVQHDPYADLASVLDDTGTSGVAVAAGAITAAKFGVGAITSSVVAANTIGASQLADNAITPAKLQYYVNDMAGLELQVNEATTALRTILFRMGTSEALTVRVSKNAGSLGVSGSTATAISADLGKLSIAAGDLDTAGTVGWEIAGATNTQYIAGVRVVTHPPSTAINSIYRVTGAGYLVYDSATGALKWYDGSTSGATLLGTMTRTTSGTEVRWTPS